MSREELKQLEQNLFKAQAELRQAMEKEYPVGSKVEVYLSLRQRMPTDGEVVDHGAGRSVGYVRVQLHTQTKKSVRDFWWTELRHVLKQQ
jgi:hypothetical protein